MKKLLVLLTVLLSVALLAGCAMATTTGQVGPPGEPGPVSYTHLTLPTNREV